MFSPSKHDFINDSSTKTGSAEKSVLENGTLENDSDANTASQSRLAQL